MADISEYCIKENLIRSNYYSETYRAHCDIGSGEKDWDIQYISIPFSERKELEFKARFNVSDDAMGEYYRNLRENLKHAWTIEDALKALDNEKINASNRFSIMHKVKQKIVNGVKTNGWDIYIFYEPLDPLIGSIVMDEQGTRLHYALNLGARLLQIEKDLDDNGFHIGMINLQDCYVSPKDDKMIIKIGNYMFAQQNGGEMPVITPDAKPYVPDYICNGGENLSLTTDMYSLVAIIWNIISANNYLDKPDFSRKNNDADIAAIYTTLEQALAQGGDCRRQLMSSLRNAVKPSKPEKPNPDFIEDRYIKFGSPEFLSAVKTATSYLDAQEIAKVQAAITESKKKQAEEKKKEEQERIQNLSLSGIAKTALGLKGKKSNEDDDEEDNDTEEDVPELTPEEIQEEKKVYTANSVKIIVFGILLAAVIGVGCVFGGKYLGEKGWNAPKALQAVTIDTVSLDNVDLPSSPTPTLPIDESNSSYPTFDMDNKMAWYKGATPKEDICAVVFYDQYEAVYETIESWTLGSGKNAITCCIFPYEEDSGLNSSGNGTKVLAVCGNGTGKIGVKRTNTEMTDYFAINFPNAVLNNLNNVLSTGATAVSEPTPVPTETPVPTSAPTSSGTSSNVISGGSTSSSATPQPTATPVPETAFAVSPTTLSLAVGESATVVTSGDEKGYIRMNCDNPDIAAVGIANDGFDGCYTITGISSGTCKIVFESGGGDATVTVTVY